jgi:multiple sugar transport system substrate-binding protein
MLKVLAVADPAIKVYVDENLNLLKDFPETVDFNVVPWAQYYTTMQDVFAGKADYDVIMVAGHLWMADFVEKGYLAPIELEKEDILPVILQEMKYKNKFYLSPSFCDGHMIVYRKSILKEKLGKTFDMVITPEEYIDAAAGLGSSRTSGVIAMKAHPSEIFTDALPFLRMGGKDVYNEKTLEVMCNEESIIKGLEAYCGLRKYAFPDTDTCGNEEIALAIQHKRAVMAVTWSGQLGVVYNENCEDKEDLGFTTFSTAWNVTWSFAISAGSRKKEKANELLRFLRSPEIDAIAGAHSGAPVRRQSYLEGKDKFPWYECQLSMIEKAEPLPNMLLAGDKNGVFYEEIAEAFGGRKSSAKAMEDAKRRIDRMG